VTDPRSAGNLPPFPARPGSADGSGSAPGSDTERFPAAGEQPVPPPAGVHAAAGGHQPVAAPGTLAASDPAHLPVAGQEPAGDLGAPSAPAGDLGVPPAPARREGVPGLRGSREDLRTALLTVLALALAGLPAGALWLWLAPRADYRVTETDVVPVSGLPNAELFISDDGVFVLILGAIGLIAGLVVWRLRSRRGALLLAALATGALAAGVVAWQLGARLGAGPTAAQLTEVGRTVTTGLGLRATAALAVGPFFAVLVYLVAATYTSAQDLGRAEPDDLPPRLPLPPVPPPLSAQERARSPRRPWQRHAAG
jgi:hypothetical protein